MSQFLQIIIGRYPFIFYFGGFANFAQGFIYAELIFEYL